VQVRLSDKVAPNSPLQFPICGKFIGLLFDDFLPTSAGKLTAV